MNRNTFLRIFTSALSVILILAILSPVSLAKTSYTIQNDGSSTEVTWSKYKPKLFSREKLVEYQIVYDYGCKGDCYLTYLDTTTKTSKSYDFSIMDHFKSKGNAHNHQTGTFPEIKVTVYAVVSYPALVKGGRKTKDVKHTTFYLESDTMFGSGSFKKG